MDKNDVLKEMGIVMMESRSRGEGLKNLKGEKLL